MSWEIGEGKRWNPGLHDYISISITSLEITDVALEQVAWPVYKDQDWQKQNTHASHAYTHTHRHAHTRGKGIYTRIYKHTHQHKLKQMYISTLVHITTLICRDYCSIIPHCSIILHLKFVLMGVYDEFLIVFSLQGLRGLVGPRGPPGPPGQQVKQLPSIRVTLWLVCMHNMVLLRLWNKTLCFTFREFKASMVFKGQRATWWVCYEVFCACITQYLQIK